MFGGRAVGVFDEAPWVGGHPSALVVELDRAIGGAQPQCFFYERMGGAVVVILELDVVVDVEPDLTPLRVFVGGVRQRHQGGLVQPLIEIAPRGVHMAHDAGIELMKERDDGFVQLGQMMEGAVAQSGEDPSLGDQYCTFDFRLVARFFYAGGNDTGAVMACQFLVGLGDLGLVTVR